MKNKNMKQFYSFFAAAAALVIFTTCNLPTGLGSLIFTEGPDVRITSPVLDTEANQTKISVNNIFILTGTAQSENEITRMEINLRLSGSKSDDRFWRYQNSVWQYKENNDFPWKNYLETDYIRDDLPVPADVALRLKPPEWIVNGKNIDWSLPIVLKGLGSGDIQITVNAWDSAGNHDSKSSFTLKIYNTNGEPQFSIMMPVLIDKDFPEILGGYVYDPVRLPDETYEYINYWKTSEVIDFEWQIDDESPDPPFNLTFELINRKNPDIKHSETVVLGHKSGSHRIDLSKIGNMLANDTTGWPAHIRVVSTLENPLGENPVKNHGWFAYLPAADNPWVNVKFAYMEGMEDITYYDAPDKKIIVRDQLDESNMAYSRHGLKELTWTLYRLSETSLAVNESVGPWESADYADPITFNGENKASWTFEALSAFGTGRFRIDVTVKDKRENVEDNSKTYSAYFTIESNTTPTVKKETLNHLKEGPLFGDEYGKIFIEGTAQISDSDIPNDPNNEYKVERVTIVWIKPEAELENKLQYINNRMYGGWYKAMDEDPDVKIWDSGYGSKRVSLGFDPSTDGNNNENGQEDYKFSLALNIFTDLEIGLDSNPLESQTFLIRVSRGTEENEKASIYQLDTTGDTESPTITFDKISLVKGGGVTVDYELEYVEKADGSFEIVDKNTGLTVSMETIFGGYAVKVTGKWDDNSLGKWPGRTVAQNFSGFALHWDGDGGHKDTPPPVFNSDKTWSWEYTFPIDNGDSSVTLIAEILDLNGNLASESVELLIETYAPVLVSISSSEGNGIYSQHAIPSMEIFMQFNKPVKFHNGNSTTIPTGAPSLSLSNGATALYLEGNGGQRIVFKYTLAGTASSTGKLNVTGINWGNYDAEKWVSAEADTKVEFPDDWNIFFDDNVGKSLSRTKNIVIDQDAPYIKSIKSGAGTTKPHGVGQEINIIVEFSEQVVIPANPSNFYINLKGGNLKIYSARAIYSGMMGSSSIGFKYTVSTGDDTGNDFLDVDSISWPLNDIKDLAGNPLNKTPTSFTNNSGGTAAIKIKTSKPATPGFEGTEGGKTYYNLTQVVTITGIEADATVYYRLDYDNTKTTGDSGWINGSAVNGKLDIPLNVNREYKIAAWQKDNANPANESEISWLAPITIDNGNVLITSMSTDKLSGNYNGSTSGITDDRELIITLTFRKELTYEGSTTGRGIILSIGGATKTAAFYNTPANTNAKEWKFRYLADDVDGLVNVTGFNFSGLTIKDGSMPIDLEQIAFNNVSSPSFSNYNIRYISGNLHATLISADSDSLQLNFNRKIFQGSTAEELTFMIKSTDYLIPAVLETADWQRIFLGRSDLSLSSQINSIYTGWNATTAGFNTKSVANFWQWVGNQLYSQSSNGAEYNSATGVLESKTDVKYVLKYGLVPGDGSTSISISDSSVASVASISVDNVKEMFRHAEALRFKPGDSEVSISSDTQLKINLSASRKLPVKGVNYDVHLPAGFVKDIINGGNVVYEHSYKITGEEKPVIRIDKGSDKLSSFKVDCRTFGLYLYYRVKESTDPVGTLITSSAANTNNTDTQRRLPNLGSLGSSQHSFFNTFNAAKNRPQSGGPINGINSTPATASYPGYAAGAEVATGTAGGFNLWTGVPKDFSGTLQPYTVARSIGNDNYNDGGMIIHIEATAASSSSAVTAASSTNKSYEAAYRSVFVFDNRAITGTGATGNTDVGAGLTNGRVWIRGGDSVSGSSFIPDFPISRNRNDNKAVLLTPVTWTGSALGVAVTSYDDNQGKYPWVWVTWKLNVKAYIDVFAAELVSGAPGSSVKMLNMGYTYAREHYPVIPGRTTVIGGGGSGNWNYMGMDAAGNVRFGDIGNYDSNITAPTKPPDTPIPPSPNQDWTYSLASGGAFTDLDFFHVQGFNGAIAEGDCAAYFDAASNAFIRITRIDGGTSNQTVRMSLEYTHGPGGANNIRVTVNNGTSQDISSPSTGNWEAQIFAYTGWFNVTLQAGKNNTIDISGLGLSVNIRNLRVDFLPYQ